MAGTASIVTARARFRTATDNPANYWVDVVFTTSAVTDPTAPTITGLTASSTSTTATISWTTDEPATSRLDYGTSPVALTSTASVSGLTIAHAVPLYGLADGATYYYRVVSADPSGNVTTAPAVPAAPASFTTTAAPSCPCSIWPASATPTQITSNDPNAVELGLRWRSLTTGYVTGVRFYKGTLNTGVHTGSLWTNTGTLLATVTFTNETETGWQEALFSSPVPVEANTPYVISYHTDTGFYSFDVAYFQAAGVINEPLEALANGVSGANGVYRYGGSGFPDSTFNAANYWVDVIFTTSTQTDTTAPSVVSTVPADGATEVDAGAPISVTFSEALRSSTVNTDTVELRDASNASVPVVVTYGGVECGYRAAGHATCIKLVVYGPRDRRAGRDHRRRGQSTGW